MTVEVKGPLIILHCWLGTEVGSVDKVVLCSMVRSLTWRWYLTPDLHLIYGSSCSWARFRWRGSGFWGRNRRVVSFVDCPDDDKFLFIIVVGCI